MENTLVVLLLLCALSMTEGAPSQNHPDLSDLYTQLGDMKAQLAEDRLMIQQLQKDKGELEAKLKELEDQDSQLEPIKEKIEEQAAKVDELEKQSGEVASIKEQLKVRQVAFFATYLKSGSEHVGKYNSQTLLIFRHVVLNIGEAYSPNTGFFTAPVKGAYYFNFAIHGVIDSSHDTGAVLVKEGQNIVTVYEYHRTNGYGGGSASNGASLLLEAGEVVAVHLWAGTRIYDNGNHHCTFSGHLLFTLT